MSAELDSKGILTGGVESDMAPVRKTRLTRLMNTAAAFGAVITLLWALLPGFADAAITRLNTMPATPQINIGTSGTNSANTNFTLSAGTDRYLTVALGCTDGNNASRTFTVTYGGTTVQRIIGVDSVAGMSNRRSAWIGGLPMGSSASASTATLNVSVSPTGTCDTWDVWVGSMAGVHQTTPVNGTYQIYENNVDNNQTYSIPVAAGGAGILAVGANTNLSSINETGHTWNWSFNAGVGAQGTNLYAVAEASNPTITFTGNYRGAIAGATLNPAPAGNTTTLGNGTDPASVTVGPGGTATNLDAFTLQASAGTDTVTAATVTLAPANAFNNIARVELTNAAGNTVYGTVNDPASNTINFSGMTLPVTTTLTTFYVRITPKTHAAMPAIPGASYDTTGTLTAYTCTNTKAGSDTASATVTIDNLSPANPTGFSGTAGNNQVALSWTNPGSDFGQVVVLRKTSSIADVPTEGTSYSAGGTVGTSTVVYVGSGSSHLDTTAVNGTGYFYKIFTRDPYGNYSSGGTAAGPYTPVGPTTTVGNGTNPASPAAPIAPGSGLLSLNAFTLVTSTGTDTVTAVTVTLTPGSHAGIGEIAITNATATVTYGSVTNPASSTPVISLGTDITATTTSTQYLVRIAPKAHIDMPAPPGELYTVSGTVSNISSTNTKTYSDTGSAVIEIDNASTDVAAWGAIVPDNTTIELNWVNPGDPDVDETAPVVVLRKAGAAFVGETPTEGVTYAVGNSIGAATVVSLGTDAFGVVEGFTDTGLTNFTDYYYAIFAKDHSGNYSLGAFTGPHQPWTPVCVPAAPSLSVTPATRTAIPSDIARYTVSLTNNDNSLCAPTTFTLDASDSNLVDFDASLMNVLNGAQSDPLAVTLDYGQTRQVTLTVFVKGTATLGNSNITTVSVTAAGHAAPADVTATTTAANPLMHNSRNTGSTKWAAEGGWGVTGGKYGTFNCFICHAESSHDEAAVGPNVKKIRQSIDMPADAPVADEWPGGGKTIAGISFLDTRAGTAEYSYAATPSKHNASTKICQVCHTFDATGTDGVEFHAYNMSTASDAQASHNNGGDCLGCHPHQGGFKAQGCTACHGYPLDNLADLATTPATGSDTIGAHVKHNTAGYSCDSCHGLGASASGGGPLHSTGAIAINFTGFGQDSNDGVGSYVGDLTTRTFGYTGNDEAAINGGTLTCASIYCHGGTIGGSSPTWTGAALACGSCHNATSGAASWLGSHATHLVAVGMDCSGCHGAGYAKHDTGTGATPAGHLNGEVVINLGAYGSYSKGGSAVTQGLPTAAAYGTCSVSCHGSGTPAWGGSLGAYPEKCVGCHNDGTAGTALINAVPAASKNVHVAHVNASNDYVADDCSACHGANAHLGTHANHSSDGVYPDGNATFAGQMTAYSTANKNCTNSCHQATTTNLWVATPPALACSDCHSGTYIGGNNAAKGWNAIPASGLHAMTASGVQSHDGTLSGGCGACHVTEPGTHIDGSFTANGAANADRWVTRANMTYTQTAITNGRSGSCAGTGLTGCHSDGGAWSRLWSTEANQADSVTAVGSTKCNVCHGQWSSLAGSAGWATGTTHAANTTRGSGHEPATPNCDACHVYGSGTARHDQNSGSPLQRRIEVNNNSSGYARSGAFAGCTACHGGAADNNYNFPISVFSPNLISGTAIPMPACASCHNDAAKAATVPQVIIGGATPSTHTDPDGAGALTNTGATPTATCEHCHAGHADGTSGANDVEIPTVYGANIPIPTMTKADGSALYASHGYKIKLGGTATASATYTNAPNATTEAQMCWGCHDKVGVSEWEQNSNADTGSIAYHYGSLFTDASTVPGTKTSDWTTGYWRSGKGLNSTLSSNPYWYKRGKIRSTHSANFDGTTATNDTGKPWKGSLVNTASAYSTTYNKNENLDAVANIRCTYCHDVHGSHNGIKGDNSTGQPYLRGTWLGNPYPEDGAPRFGMANFTVQSTSGGNTHYGVVPRASASATNTGITAVARVGGFWIDQNSGNPVENHANTAFRTATGNAGLCDQCHGITKDGTWSAAEIGAIDQVTGENLWVSGYNGHANSVIGGAGPGAAGSAENRARNIFTRTLRGSSVLSRSDPSAQTDMGLATHSAIGTSRGFSYRASTNDSTDYAWRPRVFNSTITGTTQTRGTAFQTFAWNTTISTTSTRNSTIAAGTVQLTFYTNGTNSPQNEAAHDAQANYHTFSCSKCHNPHASRLPKLMITNCLDTNHNTWEDNSNFTGGTLPAPWAGTRHSQWASAQNCHRLDARATSNGTITLGRGWNRATPWIEDTTPNATLTGDQTTLPAY